MALWSYLRARSSYLTGATPRSLIIFDEFGRGTSRYDGIALGQAFLHDIATHVGCVGFYATHEHCLAEESKLHLEISRKRMQIHVDEGISRTMTYMYKDGERSRHRKLCQTMRADIWNSH